MFVRVFACNGLVNFKQIPVTFFNYIFSQPVNSVGEIKIYRVLALRAPAAVDGFLAARDKYRGDSNCRK